VHLEIIGKPVILENLENGVDVRAGSRCGVG
jgi:hypothetical protein